jgi:AmmeMemoRadiSam system protein A
MSGLSEHHGQLLVKLARTTIADQLGRQLSENAVDPDRLEDDIFQARYATFVTLTLEGQLRGCIGSLSAVEPVAANVKKNAVNAAFHDPRFSPLSAEEFERVLIDISILSEPVRLDYSDADDLLAKLRPGIDGVLIRKGAASATFLPQVWEQLPAPQDFLGHLCLKAGLSSKAWRRGDLEVQIYQVQYFKEMKLDQ